MSQSLHKKNKDAMSKIPIDADIRATWEEYAERHKITDIPNTCRVCV